MIKVASTINPYSDTLVYIASRKKKNIDAAAAELNSLGPGQCFGLAADLSSKA